MEATAKKILLKAKLTDFIIRKVHSSFSLRHVQLLRSLFQTVGAWPTELFEGKSRRKFVSAFLIITSLYNIPGEIFYLYSNKHILSFLNLVDVLLTLFLSILTMIISILPVLQIYGFVVKDYITEFNLVHLKNKGDIYKKIRNRTHKISYFFTIMMLSYSVIAPIIFNFVPLYNNYMNGVFSKNITENYTLQFSIYYQYPWYKQEDNFTASTLINYYLSYFCGIFVCGIDLLMTLMAFEIIGHIKALRYELRELPKPKRQTHVEVLSPKTNTRINLSVELYDAQENIYITKKIVEFVNHHKKIVSFAESVSKVFGPLLAITYFFDLVSCAFLLLVCSDGEIATITRFGPITIIIFYQLIQISITFEIIGSESEKLPDEIYYIPWECMSVSNQKLVWIFLNRSQRPIRVTALGMVDVGVQAMASILKTTISYLTLLRSMGE